MKVIEQKFEPNIHIENEDDDLIRIVDCHGQTILVDKQGAKQLIEILKEFVNEND